MSSRINWGDYIKDKCQSLLERSTKLLFFSETIFLNFVLVAVDSTERLLLESLQDSVLFSFINLLIIYQLILAFLKLTIPRKKRKECSMQIWNSFFFRLPANKILQQTRINICIQTKPKNKWNEKSPKWTTLYPFKVHKNIEEYLLMNIWILHITVTYYHKRLKELIKC